MSYCEFNDAFKNMNYKLMETFNGVTSEDITLKNLDKKNSMRPDYTNSEENEQNVSNNLSGTYLSNLQSTKLTHRECINFYLNPPPDKNPNFQQAMKHLQNCNLCKEEIYKKFNKEKIINEQNINKKNINNNNNKIVNYNNKNKLITDNNLSYDNNKLSNINSNELEFLLKKYMEEDKNNKMQNMLFESKLSKYLETNQEKKEINDNLNKIYNILNNGINNNGINNNDSNKPLSIEINSISIGISILIILLIIDIIIRIKA
jgi:hypothetical protein